MEEIHWKKKIKEIKKKKEIPWKILWDPSWGSPLPQATAFVDQPKISSPHSMAAPKPC